MDIAVAKATLHIGIIQESAVKPEDLKKAAQLGIEALTQVELRQGQFPNLPHLMLPGQTEE